MIRQITRNVAMPRAEQEEHCVTTSSVQVQHIVHELWTGERGTQVAGPWAWAPHMPWQGEHTCCGAPNHLLSLGRAAFLHAHLHMHCTLAHCCLLPAALPHCTPCPSNFLSASPFTKLLVSLGRRKSLMVDLIRDGRKEEGSCKQRRREEH